MKLLSTFSSVMIMSTMLMSMMSTVTAAPTTSNSTASALRGRAYNATTIESHRELSSSCSGCPAPKFRLIASNGKDLAARERRAWAGHKYWDHVYISPFPFKVEKENVWECSDAGDGWVWLKVKGSDGHYMGARNYPRSDPNSHGMWVVEAITNQAAWERWCPKHLGGGKYTFHVSMDGHNQYLRAGYGTGTDWATITSATPAAWEKWGYATWNV